MRSRLAARSQRAKGVRENPQFPESLPPPAAGSSISTAAGRVEPSREASRDTVLVVDDDADLRDALCALLAESGYSAAACANGLEALDYLRREKPPRLILLDLMMPVMSGWEFREQQMRDARLSPIPVVVLSAHVKADLFGRSLGVENYLRKPLPLDDLMRMVAKYCDPSESDH